MSAEYDLVLVFTTFRRCGVYIPIINELGNIFRIGIFSVELDKRTFNKTRESNRLFLDLCCEIGGELIVEFPVNAKIILLPQWNYTEEQIESICFNVNSLKRFWLVSLAMGNYNYEHLYGKKIDKLLVIDRKFYDYRLEHKEEERKYPIDSDAIVEVGIPYKKYPFFKHMNFDYIWANPTPFSLPGVRDRLAYLNCVSSLIDKIGHGHSIVFKPHNASETIDYLVNNKLFKILEMPIIRLLRSALGYISYLFVRQLPESKLNNLFCEIVVADLYARLMKKVTPLKDITKYHNFNLELFLPHLKKGLITGRSNCIWHMLFIKKPIYNCVPDNTSEVSKEKMHSYNMKYFNVECCNGELYFDQKKYDVVDEKTRKADLIKYLTNEIYVVSYKN